MSLAREANGDTFAALSAGLDRKAPWLQIKEHPQAAATSVYVILRAVGNLKTILAHTPVLTHRTQQLDEYLGYEGQPFGSARGRLWHAARRRVSGGGPPRRVAEPCGADLRPRRRHRHTFATLSACLDEA